jgi:hypothetical protein
MSDDRAREGLEHLQAAAREFIAAARAMLDVAEELVDDPSTVGTIVGALGAMVKAATAPAPSGGGAAPDDDPGRGRVEHIQVS